MGGKLMGQCYTLVLSRSYRDVLMAYCNYADDSGKNAYPSTQRVAWMCDISEKQVQRIRSKLIEMEILIPVANVKGGRGLTTHYEVDLTKARVKPEFRRKSDTQMSPFAQTNPDILISERRTFQNSNPDILSANPDTQMSPDPSVDPTAKPLVDPPVLRPPFSSPQFLASLADYEQHRN